MEQNNFEKKVQQKLDEFKIPPSDAVWTNVEKRIGKKRDRRVIFILFFLLLFLSFGGFLFINSIKNKHQKNEQIAKVIKKDSKPTNNNDSSFGQKAIEAAVFPKTDTEKVVFKNSKIRRKVPIKNLHKEPEVKIQNRSNEKSDFNSTGKIGISSHNKIYNSKSINNQENQISSNNRNEPSITMPAASEIKMQEENAGEKQRIQNENKDKNLTDQSGLQKPEKIITSKNDSLKKYQQKKQKHPWVFGITFSGGTSFTTKNHPAKSNVYSAPSGNIGNGGIPGYYSNPSELKNSVAFIAGVLLEKNLSEKSKISFGISYQYFSLINKVGNRIDSLISFPQAFTSSNYFYSSANNTNTYHTYRNNFHFLEVPVSIEFRLNKGKTLPLFWNAGINISQLISSNALQFQSNPGIYYNDNSLFHKTQFGLQTGFSFTFFSKEKYPLSVGPYFLYNASKLTNEGLYGGRHFSFIGIKAEILFGKK